MASLNSNGAWCSMLCSISIKKLPAAYVLLSYGLNSNATSSVPTYYWRHQLQKQFLSHDQHNNGYKTNSNASKKITPVITICDCMVGNIKISRRLPTSRSLSSSSCDLIKKAPLNRQLIIYSPLTIEFSYLIRGYSHSIELICLAVHHDALQSFPNSLKHSYSFALNPARVVGYNLVGPKSFSVGHKSTNL